MDLRHGQPLTRVRRLLPLEDGKDSFAQTPLTLTSKSLKFHHSEIHSFGLSFTLFYSFFPLRFFF